MFAEYKQDKNFSAVFGELPELKEKFFRLPVKNDQDRRRQSNYRLLLLPALNRALAGVVPILVRAKPGRFDNEQYGECEAVG